MNYSMAKPKPLEDRAERIIRFCETYLRSPEGEQVGQKMKFLEFQKKFIRETYSPNNPHTAILSLGRKNGKSTLIAALLLAHLVGPEAIQNSNIVSCANSKEQAAIIFDLAVRMINQSPELQNVIRIQPSGKRLVGLRRNVLYRALAAEGKTAHGMSPVLAILDEVGQIEGPTDKFIEAITTAQGAYKNPLLIAISTSSAQDSDMFSVWIDAQKNAPDPRVVCHVYSAPVDCALDDRSAWAAANPAMGIFRSIEDIEKQCKAAMAMPGNEPSFRQLVLNQRCETGSPFVSRTVWKSCDGDPGKIDGRKVWAGLDLSSVNDLTALVAVDETYGVHSAFWLPGEGLAEKARKDRVPYDMWQRQGHLHTTPGKAIEYEFLAEYLRGFFDRCDVQAIGFDRYMMNFLTPWLVKAGFSEAELAKFKPFGQGTMSMTPALRELEVKLLNGQLRHGSHPILNMCSFNAVVVGDSGARKFDKSKARGRIDGLVALAMAVGVMPQANEPEKKYQIFFA